jgi:hypothetical protein
MLAIGRPLFIFGVGFLLLAYALFYCHKAQTNLNTALEELSQQKRLLQEKRNQFVCAEKFQKEVYRPYTKLKKKGVFQPTTSTILKKHLKYLLRSSGVRANSLQVSFVPEDIPKTTTHDLRTHEVILEFSSRTETPVYQFLKNMEKNLPGLLQIKKFNLQKKGRRKIDGTLEVRVVNLL